MAEKNKFFEVNLPLIDEKIELISTSEEKLGGRSVKIDLTRRLRGKSLEAIFKLIYENGKITVKPCRLTLLGYFIRRMIRNSISYVEDSFQIECNNAVMRIKLFMLTRQKVSRAVLNAIRRKAKEEVIEETKNKTYEEIFADIIANKFQRVLSSKIKKVYPIGFCEVKDILIEREKQLQVKVEKV